MTLTVHVLAIPQLAADAAGGAFTNGSGVGVECKDNNASAHPSAVETCEAAMHQDFSGRDVPKQDAGKARGVSLGAVACDAANPSVHRGAMELGDGVDNNRDPAADERFPFGAACQADLGCCTVNGTTPCAACLEVSVVAASVAVEG